MLDTWTPSAALASARAILFPLASFHTAYWEDEIPDTGGVHDLLDVTGLGTCCAGVCMLGARKAKPHRDRHCARWTVLWIMQAAGQILVTGGKRVTLNVGEIIAFDCHARHSMRPAADRSLLLALEFNFWEKPTRLEVEERIVGEAAAIAEFIGEAFM